MSVSEIVKAAMRSWQEVPPPAHDAAIERMAVAAGVVLPPEYLEFFRCVNDGEGELAVDPGWFRIWPVESVIERNEGYKLREFLPGFFGIGDNGGGELLALDMRSAPPWPVVMIPFIPLDAAEALEVAPDFETFASYLGGASKR